MKTELATFGGGCFWCLDAQYRLVKGVEKVTSGYSGGHLNNPTYDQVCSETTGHAEVVQIEYNPDVISYRLLLEMFWSLHDPTQLNRQGNDVGESYRSVIFYHTDVQKGLAIKTRDQIAKKLWQGEIVTQIEPFEKFWPAEDYHQDYFHKNPQAGYCQVVISPKLMSFRQKFASRLIDKAKSETS